MKKLRVSVIIPVYNEENYIGHCLWSLKEQSLRPLEVIVVDDGSTDKLSEVVSNLRSQISNLRFYRQRHSGPAKARNLGARKARGEILVFADADMYFARQYLEKLVEPIATGRAKATYTRGEAVANPEDLWAKCWMINSGLQGQRRLPKDTPQRAWTFRAIKKDLFLKAGGYRSYGYTDDVSLLRKLGKPESLAVEDAYCYHFNPAGLQEVYFQARWMGRDKARKRRFWELLVFTFPNSLRTGLQQAVKHRLVWFLLFKIVFDWGMLCGLWERKRERGYAK